MDKTKSWLQLFADAATTGEGSADAGHTEATAQDAGQETGDAPGKRLTWDEIKEDPEYSAHIQQLIQRRLKNAKQAEAALQKLSPALTRLAKDYGAREGDYDALVAAITAPEDPAPMQAHFQSLVNQGKALSRQFPGFDLEREMQNPLFVRLTAPHMGISLEDAYFTVHRKEIQAAALQVTAQHTARRIANAMASGAARPLENGTTGTAPSVVAFDYKNATRQQREALKSKIRRAGARGEKIYPGEGI